MTEKDVSMDYICKPVNPGHTIIPDKRSIKSLLSLCQKFHGKTTVVTSRDMEKKLAKIFFKHEASCQRWSGKLKLKDLNMNKIKNKKHIKWQCIVFSKIIKLDKPITVYVS